MRNVPTMQKGPNEELDSPIGFIAADCLEKLMHFLPSQTPLKDFIHHNSLHAFQDRKFFDAIFEASKIFGYQVTLELKDFRGLHAMGRIKASVLDRLILHKKKKGTPMQRNGDIVSSQPLSTKPNNRALEDCGHFGNHDWGSTSTMQSIPYFSA